MSRLTAIAVSDLLTRVKWLTWYGGETNDYFVYKRLLSDYKPDELSIILEPGDVNLGTNQGLPSLRIALLTIKSMDIDLG